MKVAKAKGRLRGKQPKLNRRQEAHLVSLVHSGEYSTAEVADLFGVGRSTVYRAIERQRNEARAGLAEGDIQALTPATAPVVPNPTPLREAGASRPRHRARAPLGVRKRPPRPGLAR
jgi:transposase-like protein